MRKSLLSLAAGLVTVAAFAGTPIPVSVSYELGSVTDVSALSSFELKVSSSATDVSSMIVDNSKKISITNTSGTVYFTSNNIVWNGSSNLSVSFAPAVTRAGIYSIEIPEGVLVSTNGTKVSSSYTLLEAITVGNPDLEGNRDVIDLASINSSLPSGETIPVKDPEQWDMTGVSGTLTGETGTTYDYSDIMVSNWDENAFTFGMGGVIRNTDAPAGYIQAVYGVTGVYFSEEPIDQENYWNCDYCYTEDPDKPVVPNGAAKYLYFSGSALDQITEISIDWGPDAVIGTVKTPTFTTNNYNDTRSGTIVTIETGTQGATVTAKVKSSNGVDETISGEAGSSMLNYTITGEPDTTWEFIAIAKKDGMNDSAEASTTFTIDVPTLWEPYLEYPSENWGANMPVNGLITVSNQNEVGTIFYTVNEGEVQKSDESVFSLRAVGEIGDAFMMEAWVEAEGYNPSPKASIAVYLTDNKLPAPTFAPNGGAVIAGTDVNITADEGKTLYIVYRIDGGEWMTVDYFPWAPVMVTIEKACKLEAYANAGEPEEASYIDSDIVTAEFTVEELADNEMIINKAFFDADMFPQVYEAENKFGKFEYYGFSYSPELTFSDAYYEEDVLEDNEWIRNVEAKDDDILAIRATMLSGSMAFFFGNGKIDNALELYNNDREDYVVLGEKVEGRLSAENGKWLELEGTDFEGNKFFFGRGYGEENYMQSMMIRFGKVDAVQTVEGLTEGDARYFGLDGVEVSADRLAPGVYVRLLGSKAEKVIVR